MTGPPRLLVVADLPTDLLALLAQQFEVAALSPSRCTPSEVDAELNCAEALICTNRLPLAAGRLAAAPLLRVVSLLGSGTDNVDLDVARARGIEVLSTPDAMVDAVADLTMALMLLQARPVLASMELLAEPGWGQVGHAPLGSDLRGNTLGIIGLGRIGSAVAQRAPAFGMRIVYHDVQPVSAPFESRTLDDLLAEADVVSLHVDLNPTSFHLVGRRELRLMKRTAWLLNVARGAVVDQAALAEALSAGLIASAAVDVLEVEPPPVDDPLLTAPNCLVTPHVGAATTGARRRMAELAVEHLLAVMLIF